MKYAKLAVLVLSSAATLLMAGCGGKGQKQATIEVNMTGLTSGSSLTLSDNGTSSLAVTANGVFGFGTQIGAGDEYDVTVATQPAGLSCVVSGGSGTVDTDGDAVTTIQVSCGQVSSQYNVFGTISGLPVGETISLLNNGTQSLASVTNGAFYFPVTGSGLSYNVTVASTPAGQTCTVANASGTVPAAGVNPSVDVACN